MPVSYSTIQVLQGAGSPLAGATANGNGLSADGTGYDSAFQLEVKETAGGTATLAFQGSFDGTTWYAVGYQQVDNTATPARAVANLSVTANMAHVYQLLDPYPQYRAVLSAVAGSAAVIVRAYGVA